MAGSNSLANFFDESEKPLSFFHRKYGVPPKRLWGYVQQGHVQGRLYPAARPGGRCLRTVSVGSFIAFQRYCQQTYG